jgi:excisionase family DNA binding protein
MSDEWFSLDKAAKHLGVSTRTLRRWIHAGKLQAELRPGPYHRNPLLRGLALSRDHRWLAIVSTRDPLMAHVWRVVPLAPPPGDVTSTAITG